MNECEVRRDQVVGLKQAMARPGCGLKLKTPPAGRGTRRHKIVDLLAKEKQRERSLSHSYTVLVGDVTLGRPGPPTRVLTCCASLLPPD